MAKNSTPTKKIQTKYWKKFLAFCEYVPLAVPVALVGFSLPIMILLLFDNFSTPAVLGLGIVGASLSVYLLLKNYDAKSFIRNKERNVSNILVLAGVVSWVAFNSLFTFQHVFMNRDPATYANGGIWLTKNNSIRVTAPEVVNENYVENKAPGLYPVKVVVDEDGNKDRVLNFQAAHLLPALLGIGGRFVGISSMLHLAPILGGSALLALYAFTRTLVKPKWGVIATMAFAVSLPLVYFSRDTYTEPMAATFIFGCLATLVLALRHNRGGLWFLSGLLAGAGAMARIDSYMIFTPLILALCILFILSDKADWKKHIQSGILFAAGAAITGTLAWLDYKLLSTKYYGNIFGDFKKMMLGAGLAIVVGLICALIEKKTGIFQKTFRNYHKYIVVAVTAFTLLFTVAVASQPLWRTPYSDKVSKTLPLIESAGVNPATEIVNGKEVTRTFKERAPYWVAWYIGPVLAVLSVGGIALAVYRISRKEEIEMLPALAVIVSVSAAYLYQARIFPDQIWASRRLLPVILPGVAFFGVYALSYLWTLPKKKLFGVDPKIAVTVLATLAIVLPAVITAPFIFFRDYMPHLGRVYDVCNAVPENAFVLWLGEGAKTGVQPTRGVCDIASSGYDHKQKHPKFPTQEQLILIHERATSKGYQPFIAFYTYDNNLSYLQENGVDTNSLTLVHNFENNYMESTLLRPPHLVLTNSIQAYVAEISQDGRIVEMQSN